MGQGLHPLSHSRVTNTIIEDTAEKEKGHEDEEEDESMWGAGMTENNSQASILPKKRMKHKQMEIKQSVLQSRDESSRIND